MLGWVGGEWWPEEGRAESKREQERGREVEEWGGGDGGGEGGRRRGGEEGEKRGVGGGVRLWPLLLGLMWKLSTDLCDFTPALSRGPALPLTV